MKTPFPDGFKASPVTGYFSALPASGYSYALSAPGYFRGSSALRSVFGDDGNDSVYERLGCGKRFFPGSRRDSEQTVHGRIKRYVDGFRLVTSEHEFSGKGNAEVMLSGRLCRYTLHSVSPEELCIQANHVLKMCHLSHKK